MTTLGDGTSVPQMSRKSLNSWTKVQTPKIEKSINDINRSSQGDGTSVPQKSKKKFNNLPHIDTINGYQFVTFRTYESIDQFLKNLQNEDIDTKIKQYKIDKYLDSSKKGSYLNGEVLEYLKKFFLSFDGKLYDMVAFCIMSNHVHLLFKQKDELKKIVKILKGSSANSINKILNKSGKFWESGYFDKGIRDENHFWITYEYIRNNPLKVGLGLDRFYGIYE